MSGPDAAALALLRLAGELGGERVTGSAFFAGARMLIAEGGLSRAWADIEAGDWRDLADVGIVGGARIIGLVDPALAPIATPLAAIIVYARHHRAGDLGTTMLRADGQGGSPSTTHMPT